MGTIYLPPQSPGTKMVRWDNVSSVVIVGANGAGKSRMGIWIDQLTGDGIIVHRVSAQRALMIKEFIQPLTLRQAARKLLIGTDKADHGYSQKYIWRWSSNPASEQIDDFEVVLSWLFAEHAITAIDFRNRFRAQPAADQHVGESKLEIASRIWRTIMPQRELVTHDNQVHARCSNSELYAGKEMSDGERVALYLIGQCLSAPSNAILVLDEPESHLHQSIQARLWDELESARPDCVFVYITHDLMFAGSRATAKKIWVRSYDGQKNWDWQELPQVEGFPEPLTLRILGSRKPILFVEGTANSLDIAVYRTLFPDRFVIPVGSCATVVAYTKAVRSRADLHHVEAVGIIDRDHRSDDEIDSYRAHQVFSASVAELECIFLRTEVISYVSNHLSRDASADVEAVQSFLFRELQGEMAVQVNDRTTFQVQQRLNGFGGQPNRKGGVGGLETSLNEYLAKIDVRKIHAESEALYNDILCRRDYPLLLKHFNGKALAKRVSRVLGFAENGYPEAVLRLMRSESGEPLRKIAREMYSGIVGGVE